MLACRLVKIDMVSQSVGCSSQTKDFSNKFVCPDMLY